MNRIYSIVFAISLVILLFFSVLLYRSISSFADYSTWVEHTQIVLNTIQRVHSLIVDAETGQRGFLLTKDSSFLDPLLTARTQVPAVLDTLKYLTADNAFQNANVDSLIQSVAARLHTMEETLNRSPHVDSIQFKQLMSEGKLRMVEFRKTIENLQKEEQRLFVIRSTRKIEVEKITPTYLKMIIAVTMIISIVSFYFLLKELRQRVEAQKQLERRFHSLNRSNAELRQIAHATSHDLQEPLRKIRIFSDALVIKSKDKLPQDVLSILERIDVNALKARELASDLSAFSSMSTPEEELTSIDLNQVLDKVKSEFKKDLIGKGATIDSIALPQIQGYEHQIYMMFRELIANSLKFAKPDLALEITVTSAIVPGTETLPLNTARQYRMVSFVDNGIGFEMEYASRIFVLFQKLHGQEEGFLGKGFGLSLCQRIMANHEGIIVATGKKGVGATFNLYFPL